MPAHDPVLRHLARLYGVTTEFTDVLERRIVASDETLLAVLRALGSGDLRLDSAAAAVRERERDLWRRALPLCCVAWDGEIVTLPLRLPARVTAAVPWRLELEDGSVHEGTWEPRLLAQRSLRVVDGEPIATLAVAWMGTLPLGYHRLSVLLDAREHHCALISAPSTAFGATDPSWSRTWGVFLPLYALRPRGTAAIADFEDLGELLDRARARGARLAGTLPLLAAFLDEPCDPSPYLPVSRLAWNELYVAPERLPELALSTEARSLLASSAWLGEASALGQAPLVDYRSTMAHKRRLLEHLARAFFEHGSEARRAMFEQHLRDRPAISEYALFRAVQEAERRPWSEWPQPARSGTLAESPSLQPSLRYHLFVQWVAEEQLAALDRASGRDAGLYLDFPVGVHPRGFDSWQQQRLFIGDVAVGAPPDANYTSGQNWGFPPLRPESSRRDGHRYLRACLAHHMRHAAVLRIDHVMSLWRLFWIPRGATPAAGVYVRYPAEELLAVLALESNRHRAVIVGEDLGTVAPAVRPALDRHGIRRMFILQRELDHASDMPLDRVPAGVLAGMNTHDMPPFAAYWQGRDIGERVALGLLDDASAARSRQRRAGLLPALARRLGVDVDAEPALLACLRFLRGSPAAFTIVNLEDLWLELEPQNIPGTVFERPNWRRRARLRLDEAFAGGPVRERLDMIAAAGD